MMSKGLPFQDQFVYVVDGGLLSNFPLWLFDGERSESGDIIPVVGFKMVGKTEVEPARIKGPLTMLQALVETMLTAHDERYIEQINRFRTVKIPTLGIKPTQFNLSVQDSTNLYRSGVASGLEFSTHGIRRCILINWKSNARNFGRNRRIHRHWFPYKT